MLRLKFTGSILSSECNCEYVTPSSIFHSVFAGNGVGVKVIGGQPLPWADNQIGAYVASILPGSAADQLHGELREGQ